MDWFEALTGFQETSYRQVREKLMVAGGRLHSRINGKSYGIGEFELVSLQSLRQRVRSAAVRPGALRVNVVQGDVRQLHRAPAYSKALFQVASQFNCLEMVSPEVTPEDGVRRYQYDYTQGPACAIAAGAATIYRNYFVPVSDRSGQTAEQQLDGLADLCLALSVALNKPTGDLCKMQNGYALCSASGLEAISGHLARLDEVGVDALRGKLCIGLHWEVEVTDSSQAPRPVVSQAFCSAMPVAYTKVPSHLWEPFASVILDAAYEATLCATVLNASRTGSNVVLLTTLGGGAFGNDESWIHRALRRVLQIARDVELDVKLVSHGAPSAALSRLAASFGQ